MAEKKSLIYRHVTVSMQHEAAYLSLSRVKPSGQSLFLHLLIGEHTNIIPGVYRAGVASIAEALHWPVRKTRELWDEIEQAGLAVADWKARVIYVPRSLHENLPNSPLQVIGWREAWRQIPDCDLKERVRREFEEYFQANLSPDLLEAFRKSCPPACRPQPTSPASSTELRSAEPKAEPHAQGSPTPSPTTQATASGTSPPTQEQHQHQDQEQLRETPPPPGAPGIVSESIDARLGDEAAARRRLAARLAEVQVEVLGIPRSAHASASEADLSTLIQRAEGDEDLIVAVWRDALTNGDWPSIETVRDFKQHFERLVVKWARAGHLGIHQAEMSRQRAAAGGTTCDVWDASRKLLAATMLREKYERVFAAVRGHMDGEDLVLLVSDPGRRDFLLEEHGQTLRETVRRCGLRGELRISVHDQKEAVS